MNLGTYYFIHTNIFSIDVIAFMKRNVLLILTGLKQIRWQAPQVQAPFKVPGVEKFTGPL